MATLIFPKVARKTDEIQTEVIGMDVTALQTSSPVKLYFLAEKYNFGANLILKYNFKSESRVMVLT